MSNRQLAEHMVNDLWNRQFSDDASHIGAMHKFYSTNVVVHDPMFGPQLTGLFELQRLDKTNRSAFSELHFEIVEFVDGDDRFALCLKVTGTFQDPKHDLETSQTPFVVMHITMCDVTNGKISEIWQLWDQSAVKPQ